MARATRRAARVHQPHVDLWKIVGAKRRLVGVEAGEQLVMRERPVQQRVRTRAHRYVRVERQYPEAQPHRLGQEKPALPPQVVHVIVADAVRGEAAVDRGALATLQEAARPARERHAQAAAPAPQGRTHIRRRGDHHVMVQAERVEVEDEIKRHADMVRIAQHKDDLAIYGAQREHSCKHAGSG
jgi:hypothetical protein